VKIEEAGICIPANKTRLACNGYNIFIMTTSLSSKPRILLFCSKNHYITLPDLL
jgi:hypothetical protein